MSVRRLIQNSLFDFQELEPYALRPFEKTDTAAVGEHAPGLIGGRAGENATPLFDDNEKPEVRGPGTNQFVPYDQEKAEAKYFGK